MLSALSDIWYYDLHIYMLNYNIERFYDNDVRYNNKDFLARQKLL